MLCYGAIKKKEEKKKKEKNTLLMHDKKVNWDFGTVYRRRKVSSREKAKESGRKSTFWKHLSYVTEFHYILMSLAKV